MAEELRFFVRIGLFCGGAAAVYALVSHDVVGTILLGFVPAAIALFVAPAARRLHEPARRDTDRVGAKGVPGGPLGRFVGFSEPDQPATLEVEEEPLGHSSMWPLAGAVAGLLVSAGLLFGAWFWAPGAALGAVAAWRWLHQLDG
jgi:hypothetical protein